MFYCKIYSIFFCSVIILVLYNPVNSRRYGGKSFGSSFKSRPSTSHHSISHPASLSYPSSSHVQVSRPSQTRPIGWNFPSSNPHHQTNNYKPSAPVEATKVVQHPVSQSAGKLGIIKPSAPPAEPSPSSIGFNKPSIQNHDSQKPPPYGFKPTSDLSHNNVNNPPPYKPISATSTNVKPVGYTPPGAPYPIQPPPYTPHNPGVAPPPYSAHAYHQPSYNPAGYGPPPPAYSPHGTPAYYGGGGFHNPSSPGVTNVNINNYNTNNNHHYGGGGFGAYGGGGFGGSGYFGGPSLPTYHYTSSNVGSGALGFFLGYSLAKLTTPTFSSNPAFYNGYTPRYDHYEVHHYYHNKESIPAQSTIQPNTIIGCSGDSGTICPSGTTSLCTSNGAILCVASATSTVPCTDQAQSNCVKTMVPCVNATNSDCVVGQNKTLTLPCVSKAQIPGNITYINNTIIVNNTTIINNNNGTISQPSNDNNTTQILLSSIAATNVTESARSKREVPIMNEFCVTILALPAERKPSEQHQTLENGVGIFSKVLVKAFGIE